MKRPARRREPSWPNNAGGHDAVTAGDGSGAATGVIGNARRLGGFPDYAWITPDPELSPSNFSFTAWVKIDALPSKWGVAFADYGGDFRGWYVGVNTDGRVIFSVSGLPSSNPWLLSSSALVLGEWQHIGVTFDGATRRGLIYINGLLDRTAVFPAFDPQSAVTADVRSGFVGRHLLPLTSTSPSTRLGFTAKSSPTRKLSR